MSLKSNQFNGLLPKVFNPKNFIVTNLLDDIISNTITSQQVQAPVIQRVSAETGETDDFITQSELDVELNDLKSLILGSDALSNSLNSIAEINSAINSDPQFYTHITSSISTKANQSDLNATNGNVSALDTRLDSAETTISSHTSTLSTHATQIASKLSATNPTFSGTLTGSSIVDNGTFSASGNCVLGTSTANNVTLNSNIVANGLTISPTELSRLDGITANIQSSLDSKLNASNPTFSGTLTGASIVDNGAFSASGNVTLGTSTANNVTLNSNIVANGATISPTEISYLDNVSSNLQTQLNNKLNASNPTFTGTLTGASIVDNGTFSASGNIVLGTTSANTVTLNSSIVANALTISPTELSYLDNTSSNLQNQLNNKLNASNPTFTGTLTGSSIVDNGTFSASGNCVLGTDASNTITLNSSIVANGVTVSPTELSYVDGASSNLQTQITARALDSSVCHNTSNETWNGIKTFSSSPIVPTCSSNDNSTKVATTAYCDSAISTLIGGAPSALNSLNELASALSNDSNYSTTITTALGTKGSLSNDNTWLGDQIYSGDITFGGLDLASRLSTDETNIATLTTKCSALVYDSGTDTTIINSKMLVSKDVSDNGSIYLGDGVNSDVVYLRANISSNSQTITPAQIGYLSTLSSNAQTQITARALDSATCHNTGAETWAGIKTFSSAPVLPNNSITNAMINNTAISSGYVDATSSIQTQLSAKAVDSATCHNTGTETWAGQKSFSTGITLNGTDLNTRLTNDESTISSHTSSISSINSSITTLNGKCSALTYDSGTDTTTISSKMSIAKDVSDNGSIYLGDGINSDVIYVRGNISANSQTITPTQLGYVSGASSNLQTQISAKATDSLTCHNTGAETWAGIKTFSSAPVLPNNSITNAMINNTAINSGYVDATSSIQTQLSAKATDSLTCHLAGTETVTGAKTFSGGVTLSSNITANSCTITPTELSYIDGVTSNLQTQLDAKATDSLTCHLAGTETVTGAKTFSGGVTLSSNITANSCTITPTELSYIDGVTSNLQTQLDAKATDSLTCHLSGTETITGAKTFSGNNVFSSYNHVNQFGELLYNAGSGTSLSLTYTSINGLIYYSPSANYTLTLTSVPSPTSNKEVYSLTFIYDTKFYANAISVNGSSYTMKSSGGLSNISVSASATHVLQQINIVYLNSATPVVFTNVMSLY
jgi:hypothetical protein